MNNKDNKKIIKKSVFAFLCIFSAIGILAVLGGAVFLGMKIVGVNADVENSTVATVELPIEQGKGDVNEMILSDLQLPLEVPTETEEETATPTPAPTEQPTEPPEELYFTDNFLNIVFMGDSIMDFHRDDGTSIPQLVSERLGGAHYINLAMGGTCASIDTSDKWDNYEWTSTSGAGMAKAMAGLVNPEVLNDCPAKEQVVEHKKDFSHTDVFVIEYGINDFLMNRPLDDMDNLGNPTTYQGGLTQMINACRIISPNALIVLCKPTYCEFYGKDNVFLGDYNSYLNKIGYTVLDYKGKVDCVDDPDIDIWSFEPNAEDGINYYHIDEYLEDGIHLTEAGRRRYAEMLGDYIYEVYNK